MSRAKEGDKDPKASIAALLQEMRDANALTKRKCSLSTFLTTLGPPEQAAVRDALRDPTIQVTALHRWLTKRGFAASDQVIRHHRFTDCPLCDTKRV